MVGDSYTYSTNNVNIKTNLNMVHSADSSFDYQAVHTKVGAFDSLSVDGYGVKYKGSST